MRIPVCNLQVHMTYGKSGSVILPVFMVMTGDLRTCRGDGCRGGALLLRLINH